MQKRTGGEIYIGVVGPVRTGKSTFIKRFMDVAVLPYMEDAAQKTRAQDELPQSAGGRTITTTEPKFIPQEAVELKLAGEVTIRVRLVDCVGFMVEGAAGHLEDVQSGWLKRRGTITRFPLRRLQSWAQEKLSLTIRRSASL